ncbi:MAG: PD40 domain-containing protein [Acidobacteria bacterium]|nr:PD40 domain-containing protein [Acidobacteriota bacterium]
MDTQWDIWTLPLAGGDSDDPKPGRPEPFLTTPFLEWAPAFSPDGRWLAYSSNESGIHEVYVRSFPDSGAKWQVSSGGGGYPIWSRAQPELFYQRGDGRIVVVKYAVNGDSFVPGVRTLWSNTTISPGLYSPNFDLMPEGDRVLALVPPPGAAEEEKPQTRLTFLLNFFDELKRRMPAR